MQRSNGESTVRLKIILFIPRMHLIEVRSYRSLRSLPLHLWLQICRQIPHIVDEWNCAERQRKSPYIMPQTILVYQFLVQKDRSFPKRLLGNFQGMLYNPCSHMLPGSQVLVNTRSVIVPNAPLLIRSLRSKDGHIRMQNQRIRNCLSWILMNPQAVGSPIHHEKHHQYFYRSNIASPSTFRIATGS